MIKVLRFRRMDSSKTSDYLFEYVHLTLTSYNILEKCIGLSAGNTNVNFGRYKRTGKNNLYKKLTDASARATVSVGCVAYIINNCIQNSSGLLLIYLEVTVVILY